MTDASPRSMTGKVPSAHDRSSEDWYVEPGWCWDLFLAQERFDGPVWEPCCGRGTGPSALRRAGYDCVVATDIVDRGYDKFDGIHDFFREPAARAGNIASNPPYDRANEFVRRALNLVDGKVAVLVQEKFPYSQERFALFARSCLARLYFFSTRPSMPPGHLLESGAMKPEGGSVNYLWMVWDKAHRGEPTAHWLHRSPPPATLFDGDPA